MATLKPVTVVCDHCSAELATALHAEVRPGPDPLHVYARIAPDLSTLRDHVCPHLEENPR